MGRNLYYVQSQLSALMEWVKNSLLYATFWPLKNMIIISAVFSLSGYEGPRLYPNSLWYAVSFRYHKWQGNLLPPSGAWKTTTERALVLPRYLRRLSESPLLLLSWYCCIRKQRVKLPPYLPKMVPRQATLRTVLYMIW